MKISDLLNYTGYLLKEVEKNLNLTLTLGIMLQLKNNILQKDKCKKILEYGYKEGKESFLTGNHKYI